MEMYNKPLIARLREVRDVYIFCCFTDFAYSDIYNMTPDDITRGLMAKTGFRRTGKKQTIRKHCRCYPSPRKLQKGIYFI